ncbi:MAG: lysostaphin resistance A-like protein [Anaerolineales bacterium]
MTASADKRRSFPAALLFSPDEHRLRAGWRLALQAMLQMLLTLGLALAFLVLPQALRNQSLDIRTGYGLGLGEIAEVVTVTASVWIARRLLDHRSFSSLGLRISRRAVLDLGAGIGIAMVVMGVIFAAEAALGWLTLRGFAWDSQPGPLIASNSLGFLAVFVLVGWSEELMSRGYHLQTLASGLNLGWGLVLSSAVFGVLHLANPHATWASAAGIFLAGLFLGYAYIRTRQLWLSIGLHIGWNFFEGVVFGFPVSGLDVYRLVTTRVSGPALWTGGAFGPEAGLIVVPALLAGTVLVRWYGRRHETIEASGQGRTV